jgi:ABC-type transport system substrate-binding protein/methyl-accepting chemotaxis protein
MSEGKRPGHGDGAAVGAESRISEAIERIAAGDLTPAPAAGREGSGDDAWRLLLSVEEMSRQLRRVVTGLRRAAGAIENIAAEVLRGTKGLSASVRGEAESVEETSTSITRINASLHRVEENIASLSNLSQATSASALEMATSIDQVSVNADALSQYVEETASAIEEMTASIRNVAENTEALAHSAAGAARAAATIDESTRRIDRSARETTELADDVMRSAQTGSSVAYETARTMRSIKEAIDRATGVIGSLGRRSEQVGEITNVIDEIAERTNLLALNAAVLAAQAGPQGRGFRIVADEIKELSERTAASTKEIASLISAVRADVSDATERVAEGNALAGRGVEQAYNAAALLDEISNSTVRASHKIRAIAEATSVQTHETANVRESAELVRQRAQQIEEATAEQASTSQHIGERAVHMSELTEQVRRAAEEQAEASKHIANAMEELTVVVEQIRSAVGEQSAGTDLVLRAIEVIKEGVARNQASIATIDNAADALGRESALLLKEVERFRMPEPRGAGHVRLAYRDTDVVLDPLHGTTVTSGDVLDTIFEGLVTSGHGTEIRPAIAERWEVSADGRVYTFALRPGARFHNNREIVAADVVYSFERVLREGAREGAWVFAPVEGAEEFARGEAGHVSGLEAPDDRTVRITLRRPLAFFLSTLCMSYAFVVPREETERNESVFAERPIGSGPFRAVAYTPGRRLELERFDGYYRPDRPHVDRVTVEFGVNVEEMERRLLAGDLTLVKDPRPETLARLEADPVWKANILRAVQLHTGFLVFDCQYPPFDTREVRRAICHAIDKERFVREIHADAGLPAAGPIPPGLLGYDPGFRGLEYDPDQARALLARAGFAGGFKTSLWRIHGSLRDAAFERIRDDLAAVGVDVGLRSVDAAELARARERGVAPILWRAWIADYPDPDNFTYVLFHSSNAGIFPAAYRDAEVDRLAEQARAVMGRGEREQLYRQLARLIVEDGAAAFILHRRSHVVHQRGLENLQLYPLTPIVRLEEIWFNE